MWALITTAINNWFRHRSARLGAALAYYSVFSLGPLLLIVTAIAGFFRSRCRAWLSHRPVPGYARRDRRPGCRSHAQGRGILHIRGVWSAVFGVALLLVAALGVVVQLKDALNTIFEAKEPENAGIAWYARVYAVSFAGILALGFLLAVSLVISTVLAAFTSWISGSTGESILLGAINFVISLGVLTALFAMLFKWFPDTAMTVGRCVARSDCHGLSVQRR